MGTKSIIEQRIGYKLRKLNKNEKHKLGKSYYCGYWRKIYKVIDYKEWETHNLPCWSVTCQWEDGRIATHCTRLDYNYDYEVLI